MSAHEERKHARLSPSAAHRWSVCTPSAVLEAQFPDTTSDAAREGTVFHELMEACMQLYTGEIMKRQYSATVKRLKKHDLWNDEMLHHSEECMDEIRKIARSFSTIPYIASEERYDLCDWIQEGFGTADVIMVADGILHVIDFKYGKGVPVSAERNPQLQLYALGAAAAYSTFCELRTIRMTILQPRLNSVSTWETSYDDLGEFGIEIHKKALLAFKGEGEFAPGEEQCRFCRARHVCRARAEENVRLAGFIKKKPPLISDEEVGEYLAIGEDVAKWLADLKDYALTQSLAGNEIAGWKAVAGRGSRAWTDQEAAFKKLVADGITEEALLYVTEPLSLAAVEKLVGKKVFAAEVGEYVEKKEGKPTLVRESDPREAVSNKVTAAEAFS